MYLMYHIYQYIIYLYTHILSPFGNIIYVTVLDTLKKKRYCMVNHDAFSWTIACMLHNGQAYTILLFRHSDARLGFFLTWANGCVARRIYKITLKMEHKFVFKSITQKCRMWNQRVAIHTFTHKSTNKTKKKLKQEKSNAKINRQGLCLTLT